MTYHNPPLQPREKISDPLLKPGVSLVVCCYNSSEVIVPAITALARQHLPRGIGAEVILADNNSSDKTIRLAQKTWKKEKPPFPLRVIPVREQGLIHARKAGVFNAAFDSILFVDDDNILEPRWISGVFEIFRNQPRAGIIGGYNQPAPAAEPPPWFYSFPSVFACKMQEQPSGPLTRKKTVFGAGMAIRTALIRNMFASGPPLFLVGRKGDLLMRGEDSEICMRAALMGWDVWYENSLRLQHRISEKRLNWPYVMTCRKWAGIADVFLLMYKNLLEGKPPFTYPQLSYYICREQEALWRGSNNAALMVKEGSPKSFRHHYLIGLLEGFLNTPEAEYEQNRATLLHYFSLPQAPFHENNIPTESPHEQAHEQEKS